MASSRRLEEPHPIKVRARVYIRVSGIPVATAQPPHVMNIFTLIGRLGIFHLPRRCVSRPRTRHPPSRYFIYIDGTCLVQRPDTVFIQSLSAISNDPFDLPPRCPEVPRVSPDSPVPFTFLSHPPRRGITPCRYRKFSILPITVLLYYFRKEM